MAHVPRQPDGRGRPCARPVNPATEARTDGRLHTIHPLDEERVVVVVAVVVVCIKREAGWDLGREGKGGSKVREGAMEAGRGIFDEVKECKAYSWDSLE